MFLTDRDGHIGHFEILPSELAEVESLVLAILEGRATVLMGRALGRRFPAALRWEGRRWAFDDGSLLSHIGRRLVTYEGYAPGPVGPSNHRA